jgi:hypothetical protein
MRRSRRERFNLPDPSGMTVDEFRAAMTELCDRGLITCTGGEPGDDDATYALAWMPLDNPERYPPNIRELHSRNMQALLGGVH